MLSGFINQSHFLQAIGWGILHSFWQTALLWMLYKACTAGNQKASPSFRYNLGLFCLSGSLLWFLLTAVNQYSALENGQVLPLDFFIFNYAEASLLNQNILPIISFTYLLLLVFYLLQFGRQYISLAGFRNTNLSKAPVEIRLFTQQAAYRIGIKKDVGCWLSEKADAPCVTGFFKPVILLPFSLLNHLTTAQAEAVILHELAHVKRNDYLVNIFQLIAEKLLFFNPFARLLSEAARVEREHCCDDYVLQFRFKQHEYAHALLQVEQLRSQQLVLAMNATNGKKKLLERIKRIFSTEPAIEISGGQKIKLVTVVAGMLVALVLLVPVSKNELFTLSPISVASVYTASADVARVNQQQPGTVEIKPQITPQTEKRVAAKPLIKENAVQTEDTPIEPLVEEPVSTMMINEDLLETPAEPLATAIQVNNQPAAETNVLMVRVEEEVGGSTEKKVYYVQLNNTNGQTEVKPLAIVKESVADTVKGLTETVKNSRAINKRLSVKKSKAI